MATSKTGGQRGTTRVSKEPLPVPVVAPRAPVARAKRAPAAETAPVGRSKRKDGAVVPGVAAVAPLAVGPARRGAPKLGAAKVVPGASPRRDSATAKPAAKALAAKALAAKAPAAKAAGKIKVAKAGKPSSRQAPSAPARRTAEGTRPAAKTTRATTRKSTRKTTRKTTRKPASKRPPTAALRLVKKGGVKPRVPIVPVRVVKVRELDPLAKCGANTSVQHLYRVDELTDGRAAIHLVFFDRHGWYCVHGRACTAVDDVRKHARIRA